MDDWYELQQEAINIGETLPPLSFQIIPPAHEHTHSQMTKSAKQIQPYSLMHSRGMLKM